MGKKTPIEKILPTLKEVFLENNIPFEIKNGGYHVIIRTSKSRFDFWPTSGKFMINSDFKIKNSGLTGLVEAIQNDRSDTRDDISELFEQDIDDMGVDELKKTIMMLCEYINKKFSGV